MNPQREGEETLASAASHSTTEMLQIKSSRKARILLPKISDFFTHTTGKQLVTMVTVLIRFCTFPHYPLNIASNENLYP